MVGAWHGHGMASVNQTRPHFVNQMGKTHSKPLTARHGRGTVWARHAMCESALIRFHQEQASNIQSCSFSFIIIHSHQVESALQN